MKWLHWIKIIYFDVWKVSNFLLIQYCILFYNFIHQNITFEFTLLLLHFIIQRQKAAGGGGGGGGGHHKQTWMNSGRGRGCYTKNECSLCEKTYPLHANKSMPLVVKVP